MDLIRTIEKRLGYAFANAELLEQAMTHRSLGARNYERLEFLGDGLLNCIIGAALYRERTRAEDTVKAAHLAVERSRAALEAGEDTEAARLDELVEAVNDAAAAFRAADDARTSGAGRRCPARVEGRLD